MIDHIAESFKLALLDNDKIEAEALFNEAIDQFGIEAVIEKLIVDVLKEIGDLWDSGEISLAEVYLSSKICESLSLNMERTTLTTFDQVLKVGLVNLIDQHGLGRQIVFSSLTAAGIHLKDYGSGISPEQIVESVIKDQLDILLISVLMYPTALEVKTVRRLFDEQGIAVKILVGGAPFNMDLELWKRVDADAMGKTPSDDLAMIKLWNQEVGL